LVFHFTSVATNGSDYYSQYGDLRHRDAPAATQVSTAAGGTVRVNRRTPVQWSGDLTKARIDWKLEDLEFKTQPLQHQAFLGD